MIIEVNKTLLEILWYDHKILLLRRNLNVPLQREKKRELTSYSITRLLPREFHLQSNVGPSLPHCYGSCKDLS